MGDLAVCAHHESVAVHDGDARFDLGSQVDVDGVAVLNGPCQHQGKQRHTSGFEPPCGAVQRQGRHAAIRDCEEELVPAVPSCQRLVRPVMVLDH